VEHDDAVVDGGSLGKRSSDQLPPGHVVIQVFR
jgi:hypothetical protein